MDWLKVYRAQFGAERYELEIERLPEQIPHERSLAAEQKEDALEWLRKNISSEETHTLANFVARGTGLDVPYPGYP